MKYEEEKKCFLDALNTIKHIDILSGIKLTRLDDWEYVDGIEKACCGFPYKIGLIYEIEGKANTFIQLQRGFEEPRFDKLEIISIDTKSFYRKKGYGRQLLEQIELIAKVFKLLIFGEYMPNSKLFYQKCGYDTKNGKFKKDFR